MNARIVSKEVFVPSPRLGMGVWGASYYTELEGRRLMSTHSFISRSDTIDVAYVRYSDDNGRNWGSTIERATKFADTNGTGRRHLRGGHVDSKTGRFLFFWTQGVLPTDNPMEGLRNWTLHYSISEDGGRTESFKGQIIHEGPGYDEIHHLPGMTRGKNCVMMGDLGMRPLTRKDGTILVPVQSSPVGPDGEYYNPSGGYTYLDSMVLIGRWTPQGTLAWRSSARVKADPALTTRGVFEPTLAELANDRLMMVMRGSNDSQPKLPARKWLSLSDDGGQTWTAPVPWTYTDGRTFFSPSSCSQLVPYSDGRLFWFGNICPVNAKGNGPRYPLIIAEVDRISGLLKSESVTVIDDRQPEETPLLFLSNFLVREDRETRRLVLHLTRLFAKRYQQGDEYDWTADSLIYELNVTG